jgi:ABC-type antimicrobial peptide transport system permease subunit
MGVERLEDLRVAQRSRERLNARLTAAFAALAVLLASLGMYGVTSFIVTLQKHELGVRLALGATRPQLYFAIVRRAVMVGVIGLAIGMVGALAASRSVAGLLYEVSPVDTVRYALVAAILLFLTAFAAFVPAYRAGRLDPARVLRAE